MRRVQVSGTTIKTRLRAFGSRVAALAVLSAAALGLSALSSAQAGSACTTVYGTRVLNGAGSIVYYNPISKAYQTLTSTAATDINATALDPKTGRLYYVARTTGATSDVLYYFNPQTNTETRVGVLSRKPTDDFQYGQNVVPVIIGATFDNSGNLVILYSTQALTGNGQYGNGNVLGAQVDPATAAVLGKYVRITTPADAPIYEFTNGDLVTDSNNQSWLVAEAASAPGQPRLYRLDLSNGIASGSKVINLGGSSLALSVNGLAYDPALNQYYINAADPAKPSNGQGIYSLNTGDASISPIVAVDGITDLGSCGVKPDAPTLSKSFSPKTLNGTPSTTTLTLTIGNTNPLPIYLTADLVDTFPTTPGRMTIAAAPGLGGSCLVSTGITASNRATATPGGGSLSLLSGAVIPAGGCTVQVTVSAPTPGSYTNTVAAGALNTTVGKNPMPASDTVVVKSLDVKVQKTGPATAVTGTPFNFSVTTSNVGEVDAANVVTSDVLPTQLSYVSSDNGGSYNAATRTVTWPALPTLAVGAGKVYTVTVTAQPVASDTTVTNTANVTAPGDSNPANNSAQATVKLSSTPTTPPDSGSCTVNAPYVQSFNTAGPLAEVRNHSYLTDGNAVTATDGTYTVWNQIDNTGNNGYALYYNVAAFANNDGATLATPGLLYESQITVPAGATIGYENYVRSHTNTNTRLRYSFYDGVSGKLLASYDGAFATTTYSKQSVPAFTSPSSKLIVRLFTLQDGTAVDANVLKLDDIKLSCPVPTPPTALNIVKTHSPATFQAGQQGSYTLTVSNAAGVLPSSGTITVTDTLPASVGIAPASGFTVSNAGLTWTCRYDDESVAGYLTSGQTVTCTTTGSLAAGASSAITFPVTVLPDASGTLLNKASVAGGGDPGGIKTTTDNAPVNPLPVPPATCTVGTPVNLLATPDTSGFSDRDDGVDTSSIPLIAGAGGYRQGTDASGAFVLDIDWWFNNGTLLPSRTSTLSLFVNGTEYARVTGNDGLGGAAQLVGLNGATVSANWLNRGYYKGVYPKLRSFVTLPASVTQISSADLRFTGGTTGVAGSGPSDDFGINIRSILACTKPVSKVNVVKTVQNITAGGAVGTSSVGKPGDVLEYCITTTNLGTANVTKIAFSDNVPSNTAAKLGVYAGKDIRITTAAGVSTATFAADGDPGQLSGAALSVNLPTLVLAPTQTFSVCFRASIN